MNLIWTVTIHSRKPIQWEAYIKTRDDNYADVAPANKKEAALILSLDLITLSLNPVSLNYRGEKHIKL